MTRAAVAHNVLTGRKPSPEQRQATRDALDAMYSREHGWPAREVQSFDDDDDNRGPSMLGFLMFCTSVLLMASAIIWIFWKAAGL